MPPPGKTLYHGAVQNRCPLWEWYVCRLLSDDPDISDCDLAEPGFFVGAIKTGEIFVGGKKNILCQILGVKGIAHRFQTNGKY